MSSDGKEIENVCSRCILDDTVPDIKFDADGVCNYCKIHDDMEKNHPLGEEGVRNFDEMISRIKHDGLKKRYDCIVGVSGGRDSTYTLYLAVKNGLRPLAVHFDNGWNSDIAVSNIKNATESLGVDLHTHVARWEEFKDLQKSFLKASVSDAEVPTDYVILSVLYDMARKTGVKYILNGHSFRTEGVAPIGWTYMDGRYIRSVHRVYGNQRLKSFPIMGMGGLIFNTLVKGIRVINLPEFVEYEHETVNRIIEEETGWKYYGGHHHESIYTEFFQSYYLPVKFNIDKRKLELSALVRSGQITREDALDEVSQPYPFSKEKINYTVNKLGMTKEEFDAVMSAEPRSFKDYPTYFRTIQRLRRPIKWACDKGLLPHVFYEKYLGREVS